MNSINQCTMFEELQPKVKTKIYNDNFQNFKRYNMPKAQLVIADIPYNLGTNAYASSTEWYINGDNKQKKLGKVFLTRIIILILRSIFIFAIDY